MTIFMWIFVSWPLYSQTSFLILPSFSLKREMRRVVLRDCGLDALTVALAFAYFETLVLRGAINKANREEAVLPDVSAFLC